jgi:hypothetical protein
MPTIQISKIQVRQGPASDLPSPSLDDGEFGFTTDLGRLFIGLNSPTDGQPNFDRVAFPFKNIEVLTENTPFGEVIGPVIADNQFGFTQAVPLTVTAVAADFQIYDSSHAATDFHVDLPGSGASAIIQYYVYDLANNPIRLGRLTVIWNTLMVGPPLCTDEAEIATGLLSDIVWSAKLVGSLSNQHIILQYINQSGAAVQVYFRIDRPFINVP